jgi:phosphoribosylformimino-5-aminoimidazole carboxamide ribotide isomerase
MIIIPAIDLLGGSCVRLYRGRYDDVTRYDLDPVGIARSFADAGSVRIHIVDLDAARGNCSVNRDKIREIRAAVPCTLEVGGGVRTETDIEELLEIGVDRLVIGTVLAERPDTVAGWISKYGRVFIAGIDALDGRVKVSGWEHEAGMEDTALAHRAAEIGACGIIYTNIARDGTLTGPDIERTGIIAKQSGLPVIVSGGVSSKDDIAAAANEESTGIVGVITGKALYEGRIELAETIREFQRIPEGEIAW